VNPEEFVRALTAESIPTGLGCTGKPLYLFRILKDQVTYGSSHRPFDCPHYNKKIVYKEGDYPNAEKLFKSLITLPINEFYS
jgi:dTDP-4-amino-4,6-dideoxygalactose transaminase